MEQEIHFYYYGVDKETGNKGKFELCFRHAIKEVMENDTRIETEVVDKADIWFCEECLKGK